MLVIDVDELVHVEGCGARLTPSSISGKSLDLPTHAHRLLMRASQKNGEGDSGSVPCFAGWDYSLAFTAQRSFAGDERGLARCSSMPGRMTSVEISA